ncbi:response regulator [Brevibacillus fortis]|uniref:Response regulator n=1 Tax=Brevibacillus fortis TaxID=2126352 RepID=A0A2P7VKD7_9BACL|nr:response regulator [Brevibacillus fortis]MED1782321.1 response regulator [Brevibacillus fortis]PSJ99652.1 response regulator [Brevibacillus fortis]
MRQHYRVIIIDDDPITRMDLVEMLQEQGYNVVAEGKNGKEAVRLTQMWNPHLIIMDVKMPIMDGLTATGIIREHSDAAIILLTAYSQKDMVTQAKAKGICAYLVKPVMEEELLPAVEFVLTGKQ